MNNKIYFLLLMIGTLYIDVKVEAKIKIKDKKYVCRFDSNQYVINKDYVEVNFNRYGAHLSYEAGANFKGFSYLDSSGTIKLNCQKNFISLYLDTSEVILSTPQYVHHTKKYDAKTVFHTKIENRKTRRYGSNGSLDSFIIESAKFKMKLNFINVQKGLELSSIIFYNDGKPYGVLIPRSKPFYTALTTYKFDETAYFSFSFNKKGTLSRDSRNLITNYE